MRETILIQTKDEGKRLDIFLNEEYVEFTRSYLKTLIEKGEIVVNEKQVKAGYKLREGDDVLVNINPPEKLEAKAENIDFEIVYEDEDLLVINKPQGLVVHPCASTKSGTLVNGLLAKIKDLSGINGVLRPGIIHRLDKNTSGLMLVAKNDFSHKILSEQIKNKDCHRTYLALVEGHLRSDEGKIETFIERNKNNRLKMAVSNQGKWAITHYKVVKEYEKYSLVRYNLKTGRTHQIRVHSAYLGHSVVGDDLYGKAVKGLKGQLLHSTKIEFSHPRTGKNMVFECKLPKHFEDFIKKLK